MALEKALSETPINVEVPRAEHHNRLISCQVACPVHTDARGYVRAIAAETQEATDELYHRLFGPGGTISPREVSYCRFEDPGQVMAQRATFYQAFSFAPRREESIDHISVEAGVVGYLFLKALRKCKAIMNRAVSPKKREYALLKSASNAVLRE